MNNILLSEYNIYNQDLKSLPERKLLITTINAYSYNLSKRDEYFAESLAKSDVLIPDGISIVWAVRLLTGKKLRKIAGADLFFYELNRLNATGGSCFFLGSSESTLQQIADRIRTEFPNIHAGSYSPPYKSVFNAEDNALMVQSVNTFNPEVLFIGMTAPKQEKWAYEHLAALNTGHICCIGAVFDFFAGTVSRAPRWMIGLGLEWFYRLIREPSRMWRRYLIGNSRFIWLVIMEKFGRIKIFRNAF